MAVIEHGGTTTVEVNGRTYEVAMDWRPGAPLAFAQVNGEDGAYQVERNGIDWVIRHRGYRMKLRVMNSRAAELFAHMPVKAPPDMSRFLLSPMPGLLVRVMVEPVIRLKRVRIWRS